MAQPGEETAGKPLFSAHYLRALIMPLIGEQFLAVLIGMADTVMVSSCGEAAVSGVSLIDGLSWLMIALFAAFATGGAVVASQYLGHGDNKSACDSAKQLLNLSIAAGLLIVVICAPFRRQILALLYGQIEASVMKNALIYFTYMIISYPFLAVYNSCAALFRSMGDSRMSLKVSLMMNVINIGGNALNIYIFGMGPAGAGLSTVICRAFAAILMLVLLCDPKRELHLDHIGRFEWNSGLVRRILKVGVPTGVENSLFQIGKLLVQTFMAGFGTASIAANAISNSIAAFATIPGNGIGLGSVTVIGQCIGAGEKKQAVGYGKRLLKLSYESVLITGLILFFTAPCLVPIFNLSPEATRLATDITQIYMVVTALIWPLAFMLPNVLRAAGDAKFTMYVSMFSMWIFRVGSSYFLSVKLGWGLHGVWIGMYIDWACRALLFALRFIKGKWLQKKVI